MNYRELARLALDTLDAQQNYFKLMRSEYARPQQRTDALDASKALEKRLRLMAKECLDGQARLFKSKED